MACPTTAVWYYKEADTDELKYSIRSAIKNLGIQTVILVGDKPKWFKESEHAIYVPSVLRRNASFTRAWIPWQHMETFVNSHVYQGDFLLFNDDFFILQPIYDWIDYHRDPANYEEKVEKGNRAYHLREKRALFALGLDTTSSPHYNMHLPMKMNTELLQETIAFWNHQVNKDIEFRTTYGNMHLGKTPPLVDVKYAPNEYFFSSGDRWWQNNAEMFREAFKDKSFVER